MRTAHLRVYHGPAEDATGASVAPASLPNNAVTVRLMDVLPLLADAVESKRTWLGDFADDEISISMDLYEVLLAYQHYRRPSA